MWYCLHKYWRFIKVFLLLIYINGLVDDRRISSTCAMEMTPGLYEAIGRIGLSVPTANCSPVSPLLRFVATEPSRMKFVHTEGCDVGLSREFVGTTCTHGQSNTTIDLFICCMPCGGWLVKLASHRGTKRSVNLWGHPPQIAIVSEHTV